MNWTIPGTVLTDSRANADHVDEMFRSMFLAGGMVLSQVSSITGLEAHTVQNWVKRGFLEPPKNKRYDLEQVCRIITINMLKGALPLEKICTLMRYINGDLADNSDDIIDDALLYFMFVKLAARARYMGGSEGWENAIENAMSDYQNPGAEAKSRVEKVLRTMVMAWIASRFKQHVDEMVEQLK